MWNIKLIKNILLYFDTSALVKEFQVGISSSLVSKISSTCRNDIQIISSIWTFNEIISVMDKISQKINEKTGMFKITNNNI